MSKKAKPSKTTGSKKDSVTGLSIKLKDAGLTIESDKIYGNDTRLYKSFAEYSPDIIGGSVEFELGSQYVIITTTQLRENESKPWTTRQVFDGVFTYKNGVMTSAKIRSQATVNIDSGSEMGNIKTFPGGTFNIKNASNSSEWSKIFRSDFPQEYEITTYQYSPGSSAELIETGGGKSAFLNYGGGRFFSSGWETKPFTPNLI